MANYILEQLQLKLDKLSFHKSNILVLTKYIIN